MLLFRASFSVAENYYWKEGELILKEKHFSAGGNQFFLFSCQKKQFVLIAEMYILTNALFRVVEIDFLVNPNHFLHISSETSASDSFCPSTENVFLNESFIPAIGEGFYL